MPRSKPLVLAVLLAATSMGAAAPASANDSPVNDSFANARSIDTLPFADETSTLLATVEPQEPSSCGLIRTLWYRYTADAATPLKLRATTDQGATGIAIYDGTSLGALRELACSRQHHNTLDSFYGTSAWAAAHGETQDIILKPGAQVFIQVGEYARLAHVTRVPTLAGAQAAAGSGSSLLFTMNTDERDWGEAPMPLANDTMDQAMVIDELPFINAEVPYPATFDADGPRECIPSFISDGVIPGASSDYRDVWYRYDATTSRPLYASVYGATYGGASHLAVYRETDDGLDLVLCGRNRYPGAFSRDAPAAQFRGEPGARYWFQVATRKSASDDFVLFGLDHPPIGDVAARSVHVTAPAEPRQAWKIEMTFEAVSAEDDIAALVGRDAVWQLETCAVDPTGISGCRLVQQGPFALKSTGVAVVKADLYWLSHCPGDVQVRASVIPFAVWDVNAGNDATSTTISTLPVSTGVGAGQCPAPIPFVQP